MVTENFAFLNKVGFAVNGYHKIPPTQTEDCVSSALSGPSSDSTANSLPKTVSKVEAIRQPPDSGPGENVSPLVGPTPVTSNTFQVLPVGLPNGTPYLKLLKNKRDLSLANNSSEVGKHLQTTAKKVHVLEN